MTLLAAALTAATAAAVLPPASAEAAVRPHVDQTVCLSSTVPVEVAVVQAYQCVYARGGGVGDNAISIRKL